MKKWLSGSLVLVIMMFVAAGVYAQTQNKDREKGKDKAKTECKAFVDENKDGICDNHGTDKCKQSEGCKSGCDVKKEGTVCSDTCKTKEAGCCEKKGEVVTAPKCCGRK
jgi:hypothetical protein